jgi:hypothetical protein
MRRFGTARTASLKEESVMAAFRKSWTLASAGPTARHGSDALLAHQSGGNHSSLDLLSGVEVMCEMLIALAMAAAISIGLISLSAHLTEAKTFRQAGGSAMQSTTEHRLPSAANVAPDETASHYN